MRGSNIIILNNSILALRVLLLGFVNVCVAKHFILWSLYPRVKLFAISFACVLLPLRSACPRRRVFAYIAAALSLSDATHNLMMRYRFRVTTHGEDNARPSFI